MQLRILNTAGADSAKQVEFSDKIFAKKFNEDLIHQAVQAYRAGGRAGTKAQKSRSEVSGGGIKPRPQKGSGRARAGTTRSPIWRKGGVTFAAKPRDYTQKLNKKMYAGAMCSILAELLRLNRLLVVEEFGVTTHKTRDFVKKLADFGLTNALIVVDSIEPDLYLAARNLYNVAICDAESVNPLNLIGFENVLFTVSALKKVEERLV